MYHQAIVSGHPETQTSGLVAILSVHYAIQQSALTYSSPPNLTTQLDHNLSCMYCPHCQAAQAAQGAPQELDLASSNCSLSYCTATQPAATCPPHCTTCVSSAPIPACSTHTTVVHSQAAHVHAPTSQLSIDWQPRQAQRMFLNTKTGLCPSLQSTSPVHQRPTSSTRHLAPGTHTQTLTNGMQCSCTLSPNLPGNPNKLIQQ